MVLKRPKVCIFVHGGFFSGKKNLLALEDASQIKNWTDEFEELQLVAEVDFVFLATGYGYDLSVQDWTELGSKIVEKYDQYEGFVVVQGIDTIEYTASALSFMLQGLTKPIIVTAVSISDHHPSEEFRGFGEFGLRANLLNSVHAATSDMAEVAIIVGEHIIRANRNIYDYSDKDVVGAIRFGVELKDDAMKKKNIPFTPQLEMSNAIPYIQVYPTMDISQLVNHEAPAIFLRAYENGFLPEAVEEKLNEIAKEKPVIVSAAHTRGKASKFLQIDDSLYEKAAFIKFSWLLGSTKDKAEVYQKMQDNMVNEYRG